MLCAYSWSQSSHEGYTDFVCNEIVNYNPTLERGEYGYRLECEEDVCAAIHEGFKPSLDGVDWMGGWLDVYDDVRLDKRKVRRLSRKIWNLYGRYKIKSPLTK